MKVDFANSNPQKLGNGEKFATRKLGAMSARKLRSRLADIAAAHDVTELVAGRRHPLTGDRSGGFSIRLHGGHRLVFRPDHDPVPALEDGGTDWSGVTAVMIVEIGDYHRG